jgi:hypothetical protein
MVTSGVDPCGSKANRLQEHDEINCITSHERCSAASTHVPIKLASVVGCIIVVLKLNIFTVKAAATMNVECCDML